MTAAGELPRTSVASGISPNKNKPFVKTTRFSRLVARAGSFFRLWRYFVSDFGGILLPTLADVVISKTLGNAENEIEGAIEQRNGFGISLDIGLSVVISHAEGYHGRHFQPPAICVAQCIYSLIGG